MSVGEHLACPILIGSLRYLILEEAHACCDKADKNAGPAILACKWEHAVIKQTCVMHFISDIGLFSL